MFGAELRDDYFVASLEKPGVPTTGDIFPGDERGGRARLTAVDNDNDREPSIVWLVGVLSSAVKVQRSGQRHHNAV
jgi:hypothetical protein